MSDKERVVRKKPPRRQQIPEEEQAHHPPAKRETESPEMAALHDPFNLEMLHDQVGNLGVQELLAGANGGPVAEAGPDALAHIQRQLAEEETAESEPVAETEPEAEPAEEQDPEEPVEVGDIKIEKPEIKFYDIQATSLEEAVAQIKDPNDWYEFKYEYDINSEGEQIHEVDITVSVTAHLPQWIGPGWDDAVPAEQAQWQEAMAAFQIYEDEFEETTEIPQQFLLGMEWEEAPTALKTEWRSTLEGIQKEEENLLDLIYRRALVLQQRLLNRSEKEAEAIFNEFMEDLEDEESEYNRKRDAEKELDISLSGAKILQ